jgi:membrane protease subunit HflC
MSRLNAVLLAVLVLLIAAWSCVFTVSENELAIRVQFRKIIGENYGPGLHFKSPIDSVIKFERRIVSQSFQGETFLTNENRGLIVDYYVKWRINNAARYFRSFTSDEDAAGQRLADIVKDNIKNAVAQRTLQQIVSAERREFTGDMMGRASKTIEGLGIELIDVRVQRIDLPEDVAGRVYASMQQSFEGLARQLRGEGEKEALRIRAEADRKKTEIIAAASRDSLKIRGEADLAAGRIYAAAYSKNPEFYSFYRSLQAYRNSLAKDGDVMVVAPDGEFFRYLRSADGRAASARAPGPGSR